MPKVGDRVIIEGTKVGAQRREGNLLGVTGSLMKVRWADGTESMISPGAGSIRFEPRAASAGTAKKAAPAKKPAKSGAKKASKKR